MPIPGIEQPELLPIDGELRLRKFDGAYDFALDWYQDAETVWLVDGVREPYTPEKLKRMYEYLDARGELYFIEALEKGNYKPIGDVCFWREDMPIVIGDRAYRGRGLGRRVVAALIGRGRALGYATLYVNEIYDDNRASRRCFESAGFRLCEKTEKGGRYVYGKEEKAMEKTIYLAGGCFWGTQRYFDCLPGVLETEVGYANGRTANPSYEQVKHEGTGHAETVKVVYDPALLSLPELLEQYYKVIDPTSLNRQGGDVGTQYRTGIYYTDPAERETVEASLAALQTCYEKPLAVEARPLENFYTAEEYHQKYLEKNPAGYCHISPAMFEAAKQYKKPPM